MAILQQWVKGSREVARKGPTTSPEPLAHHCNIASKSLFYRYYFGRGSSELAQLVPLPSLEGGLLVILIDCMNQWNMKLCSTLPSVIVDAILDPSSNPDSNDTKLDNSDATDEVSVFWSFPWDLCIPSVLWLSFNVPIQEFGELRH